MKRKWKLYSDANLIPNKCVNLCNQSLISELNLPSQSRKKGLRLPNIEQIITQDVRNR